MSGLETEFISKEEAAEILGVSVRTVERLVSKGSLPSQRVRGKTRPRIMLERKAVESKRDEPLYRRSTPRGPTGRSRANDSVGFRLEPFYIRRLEAMGAAADMSRGEMARRLVIQGIEDTSLSDTLSEIRKVRQDFSETLYLLLIRKLGASEQEASEIVRSMRGRL